MKKILALMLALVMVFALAACGEEPAPSTESEAPASVGPADVPDTDATASLDFGTGSSTGTYYGFGSTFATYISNNTGVKITAVTSDGSQANIEMVNGDEQDLGFVQSDVMDYAYNGTRLFVDANGDPAPLTGFSTLAALYMEQVQIVTLDPDIKTVADLEGKYVSIGARGSGAYFNAIDVLGAYGLTEEDISPVYQDFDNSVESLQDGKIDAAFIVAGAPTTSIVQLATSNDVYLVSLDQEHIDMVIISCASMPDRTSAIKTGDARSLLKAMRSCTQILEGAGCANIAIPCNTSHFFYDQIQAFTGIPVIHMPREAVRETVVVGGARRVGVMGTDGTVASGVYARECEALGATCVTPPAELQASVMSIIYDDVKAGRDPDLDAFDRVIEWFLDEGACDSVILACTELSVVSQYRRLPEAVLDAMDVLVRKSILLSGARSRASRRRASSSPASSSSVTP